MTRKAPQVPERSVSAGPFPWVIAFFGMVLLTIAYANWYTGGVFSKPMAETYGMSREQVSGVFSIRAIVMAIFVAPMGFWADRRGPKWVLFPSFLILAAGLLIAPWVSEPWQFYATQGVLLGIGTAGPFVCSLATVGKWHTRHRGIALGITASGVGLCSVIFPPLAAALIPSIGWQKAMAVLGAITLVAVPVSFLFKNPPATSVPMRRGEDSGPFGVWKLMPGLMRNGTFFSIFLMFLFFYTACHLVVNHLVNYVTDGGTSTVTAAAMMSAMGVASVAGRVIMGIITDRAGTKFDTLVCNGLLAGSLVLMLVRTDAAIWVAVVLFGVGFGGAAPLIPALIGEKFGTGQLATLMGVATIGAMLGNAFGPWLGGFVFDLTHGYAWAITVAAVLALISLIIAWSLPHGAGQHKEAPES